AAGATATCRRRSTFPASRPAASSRRRAGGRSELLPSDTGEARAVARGPRRFPGRPFSIFSASFPRVGKQLDADGARLFGHCFPVSGTHHVVFRRVDEFLDLMER